MQPRTATFDPANSSVRKHLTYGHLRRDLFAPTYFCACGARATIVRYGDPDVCLCNRCHALDNPGDTPGIDQVDGPVDPDPAPGRTARIWRASHLVGCHTLHRLAQTDAPLFRAKLAALSDAELATQARLFAIYATDLCGVPISEAETLEQFRLAADVHRATVDAPRAPHPIVAAADACAESYAAMGVRDEA